MERCVIAYFPGSGGNRLARLLAGHDWSSSPNTHFHRLNVPFYEMNYDDRDTRPYPRDHTVMIQRPTAIFELTHCLDTALLLQHFPGRKIIKIKTHFVPSYNRCWELWSKEVHQDEIAKKGLHYAMNFTLENQYQYYKETGVDWWADIVYDVNNDEDDFCKFMRKNIAQYQHTEFAKYAHTWQELKKCNLDFGY